MSALGWTPRDGETVHLRSGNAWSFPAGRYTLRHHGGEVWTIRSRGGESFAANQDLLEHQESATILTPISPAELEREKQAVQLLAQSPMRGRRDQHGTGALGLFASDQGAMI